MKFWRQIMTVNFLKCLPFVGACPCPLLSPLNFSLWEGRDQSLLSTAFPTLNLSNLTIANASFREQKSKLNRVLVILFRHNLFIPRVISLKLKYCLFKLSVCIKKKLFEDQWLFRAVFVMWSKSYYSMHSIGPHYKTYSERPYLINKSLDYKVTFSDLSRRYTTNVTACWTTSFCSTTSCAYRHVQSLVALKECWLDQLDQCEVGIQITCSPLPHHQTKLRLLISAYSTWPQAKTFFHKRT